MKKIFLSAIIGLISLNVYSQEEVPNSVLKTFQTKFLKAEDIKWEIENPNEWEAEFKLDGKEVSACFDASGKWLETETKINKKDLPAELFKNLWLRFEGFEIDEVESIETPSFKGYELVLEKQDTEIEVTITNSGEITINGVKVDENDDEDRDHDNGKDE